MSWRLLDRLLACEPGKSATGEKRFPADLPLFAEHFPGLPTVPGVLQIEMIAAAGGKALRLAFPDRLPMLIAVKSAKFHRRIAPGELCLVRAEILQLHSERAAAAGRVEVDGERAAEATVLYVLAPLPAAAAGAAEDPLLAAWRRAHAGAPR
jgi:3-hydroxyacyl-[acyl-carrier-protein] dehydratase